ncbi:hypothetical protein LEN26_001997 [Aphanomyces euteiches]|nr:hypothetical protein AeMF1_002634 [Aphanomyces euteiches]KAH9160154.1 hypothetical protein LEN26_001997 [Aphanomyces euteiches]KAH9181948.1 hypothetical protein AeNC1_016077 [Aphanomyces euteiches]
MKDFIPVSIPKVVGLELKAESRLCHQLVQGQDPFDDETGLQLNEAQDATPLGIRQLDHTVETTRCDLALESKQALIHVQAEDILETSCTIKQLM